MRPGIGYSSTQPRFIGAHPQIQGKFCPAEPVTPSEPLPKLKKPVDKQMLLPKNRLSLFGSHTTKIFEEDSRTFL